MLLEVFDDRLVELIAGDAHRLCHDDVSQTEDRDIARPAADVADHAGDRLGDRQARSDAGGFRLFDQVDATGAGSFGAVEDGSLFNRRDAAGNGNDDSWLQSTHLPAGLLNE